VNEELFTGDLDITSAHTRGQLAALLRTIHLRADRPSLRTLEARTRHDNVPLSKTVVSEMLKGTRFPRKAVMISFLHACGVPEDTIEPWRRAWERIAADEQDLSQSAARWAPAMQDQLASDGAHEAPSATAEQAGRGDRSRGDTYHTCRRPKRSRSCDVGGAWNGRTTRSGQPDRSWPGSAGSDGPPT
jgi:hypothetical protein